MIVNDLLLPLFVPFLPSFRWIITTYYNYYHQVLIVILVIAFHTLQIYPSVHTAAPSYLQGHPVLTQKSTTPGRAACNSNSPQGCTYFVISVINGLSVISQEHKVQIFVSESSFPVHRAVLPASGNIPGHIPYFHWLSS